MPHSPADPPDRSRPDEQRPSDLLSVTVDHYGSATVVRVAGEIDLYTLAILRDTLDGVTADGHGSVVLDLSLLRFIGSIGVVELMRLRTVLTRAGRPLRLAAAPYIVRSVLRLTGLDKEIEQHHSVAQALRAPVGHG